MNQISDHRLQIQFLSSLAYLSTFDMTQAKKFIQNKGVSQLEFDNPSHWSAYCSISACISSGLPCSGDNLCRELRKIVPDQAAPLTKAILSVDSGGFLDSYYDKLIQVSERRQTLRLIEDSKQRLINSNEKIGQLKFRISNSLQRTRGKKSTTGLDQHVKQLEDHVHAVSDGRVKPVNPWYIPELDREIGGLQRTLTLIGAEPGVGKSALIASGVSLQAQNGHRPLVITLEDPPDWLAYRCVSNDSGIGQFDLRFTKIGTGKLQDLKKNNKDKESYRRNIRIIDGSDAPMRIQDIISSTNDAIVNQGCDSVWLDHVGQIAMSSSERYDLEISRNLSLLRGLANKHGVAMIAAAHFKRAADPEAAPSYRDFANSSGAERKARVALGLKRNPGSDVISVHIMKQTNGPAGGVVNLRFGGAAAMIVNTEGGYK